MTFDWQRRPFEECIEPVVYTEKIQRKDFLEDGAHPIISQEDGLINGYWNDAAALFKTESPLVVFGDHTRTLKYVDFDFVLGADGVKILRPKPFLSPRFFYYQLQTTELPSLGYSRHYRLLKELSIHYPPIPEQQRIVGILDEAFAGLATAKANAEKNLQNARALFDAHVGSIFFYRSKDSLEKSFGDICTISSALVDPREKRYLDLPHVGGANIASKTGQLVDLKTAREEKLISGKFVFDGSMVLYSKIRPYLMKVARPDFEGLCSADIYPLTPKSDQLDRNYLFYLLLSPEFTAYANQGSARAGMPKINRDHLFAFRTWLPPVTKQKEFSARLDKLHVETQRLESLYQRKLAALDELKKSLLHQAFTGAL